MQTTQYPVWKRVLKGIGWFFGIVAYGAVAMSLGLIVDLYYGFHLSSFFHWLAFLCPVSLIVLPVVPVVVMIARRHRAASLAVLGMALAVVAFMIGEVMWARLLLVPRGF